MIDKITIIKFGNGVVVARFDTHQAGDPRHKDFGTRVKHYIYEDTDFPGTFWHERVWLSRVARYRKPTYIEMTSERRFWGKVRLCRFRTLALQDTWMAVAQCVDTINKLAK